MLRETCTVRRVVHVVTRVHFGRRSGDALKHTKAAQFTKVEG